MTDKTQEELDQEQQAQEAEDKRLEDERIAKEKEDNPDDPGEGQDDDPDDEDSYDEEVKKKGAKNVILENKRKAEDNKKLKEENEKLQSEIAKAKEPKAPIEDGDVIATTMKTAKGRRFIESERAYGKSDSEITATLEMMDLVGETKQSNLSRQVADSNKETNLSNALEEMLHDDEDKIAVEMFGKDIKAEMVKEKIKPEYWGDKTLIKSFLGTLLYKNKDKFAKQQREIVETVLDGGKKGGSPSGGGVSNEEMENYANDNGIELSTNEIRSKVRKAILTRRKALKE